MRDAAVASLGIALHSTWHICDDFARGRLQIVLPKYTIADTGIYAVMPQRRLVPPRVRAFIDFLVDHFQAPFIPVDASEFVRDRSKKNSRR